MKFGVTSVFLSIVFNVNIRGIIQLDVNAGTIMNTSIVSVKSNGNAKYIVRNDFYSILEKIFSEKNMFKYGNLSEECIAAGYMLLHPISSFTKWEDIFNAMRELPLGKMLDAWGKPPERLLLLNSQWVGAYDECSDVENAKYCLSQNVKFVGQAGVSYGSCFPKECTVADVVEILSVVSNYTKGLLTFDKSSTSTYCEKPTEYSAGVIITLIIICAILLLCLIGTLFETAQMGFKTKTNVAISENSGEELNSSRIKINGIDNNGLESQKHTNSNTQINMTQMTNGIVGNLTSNGLAVLSDVENEKSSKSTNEQTFKCNRLIHFFVCFSLLKNTRAILSTHVTEGSITSINGIRVISLAWVILGHFYVFGEFSAKPDNIINMVKLIHRFSFLPVNNAYVSVDTFFLLSGLLVSYLTLKRIDKKGMGLMDIMMFYVHRYIRLTPSLLLVILFYTNIFPIIVKQPMGFTISEINVIPEKCIDYWWPTLLYINNFYPDHVEDGCIGWTWYLANDMQFYIISPGILLLMVLVEKKLCKGNKSILYNFLMIMLMCGTSILITAIITAVYNIPTLLTSALFLPDNPRKSQSGIVMDRIYDKPYCRITPYLVGILLGYLFSRKLQIPGQCRKLVIVIGWVGAVVIGCLVVYGPWDVYKDHGTFFNDAENIIYSAFHRFAWSCGVGWVIYACHNKAGGLVNTFLSWKVWIPLSRLTYGCYLLHIIVILFFTFSKETSTHYQDNTAVFDFLSNIVVSYACSFILAVCVEYPIFNLEKIIFKR